MNDRPLRRGPFLWGLAAAALLGACGGGGSAGGGGTTPPPAPTPPTITGQPADATAAVGQTATFTVTATGTAPLAYQWSVGGASVAGATGASYTTPTLVAGDNGKSYTVTVTNAAGSATSRAARLTVTGTPPQGSLTVVRGSAAGGALVAGTTLHLYADAPAVGEVFDRWTGDTAGVANVKDWHTTLTFDGAARTITAQFRSTPTWNEVRTQVNGTDWIYHVPASPLGLIVFFHGGQGSAGDWFVRPESLRFLVDAVARGFGVAAITSVAPSAWVLSPIDPTNQDYVNTLAGIQLLRSRGLITASTPLFVLGSSAGGVFAPRVSDISARFDTGIRIRAGANVVSQGQPASLMLALTVPTRFNMQLRDDQANYQTAQEYSTNMAARGIASEFLLNQPSPLYPKRFLRIHSVTEAESTAIYTALRNAGKVDANGFVLENPDDFNLQPILDGIGLSAAEVKFVEDQLNNAYAEHGFFGDHVDATLSFFERAARGG